MHVRLTARDSTRLARYRARRIQCAAHRPPRVREYAQRIYEGKQSLQVNLHMVAPEQARTQRGAKESRGGSAWASMLLRSCQMGMYSHSQAGLRVLLGMCIRKADGQQIKP